MSVSHPLRGLHGWLRPRRDDGLDWLFIRRGLGAGFWAVLFSWSNIGVAYFYLYPSTDRMWLDARIYFRATEAWIAGANPWTVSVEGVRYAAPPPSLLLNLPLLPLGESAAVAVWVVANAAAVVFLIRRFRLPFYWVLFHPIAEGFLGGSPDLTLAALVFLGAGAAAAVVKPYSIPAMLSSGRWRAIVVGLTIAVVTIPVLPWDAFFASRDLIETAFRDYGSRVSAAGVPVLLVITAIALLSVGLRPGLALATPGLLAQQPHYLVFSLETIAKSRILTAFMTLPFEQTASIGIVVYAVARRVSKHRPPDRLIAKLRRNSDQRLPDAT